MPYYEFSCPKCGGRFEMNYTMKESAQGANCPKCGKAAERIFSLPIFRWGGKFKEDKK